MGTLLANITNVNVRVTHKLEAAEHAAGSGIGGR